MRSKSNREEGKGEVAGGAPGEQLTLRQTTGEA